MLSPTTSTSYSSIKTLCTHRRGSNRTRFLQFRPCGGVCLYGCCWRSRHVYRIQQFNIHTPIIRPSRTPTITPKKLKFIRHHTPSAPTSRRATHCRSFPLCSLSFITPFISSNAIICNDPGAKRSETSDDDGDGLFDCGPSANPGGGSWAAPGGI